MRATSWGLLGSGAIAHQFAQGLKLAPEARLVAVASRRAENATAFAAQYSCKASSFEELLADPAIDVVYIATPNEFHHPHALAAIAAGKAVLCEKPFALNLAQAEEMIEAARARNVFCMEAMWMRCAPAVKAAVAAVRGGAVGKPALLTAQLGFANRPSPDSRLFAPPGGGALLDLGVYPLALAQALFGAPQDIQAQATFGATGVDETVSILLRYADGAQASIGASLRTVLANSASLNGDAGVLAFESPLYFPVRWVLAPVTPLGAGQGGGGGGGLTRRLEGQAWSRPAVALLRKIKQGRGTQRHSAYPVGTGYTTEAIEVMRCLHAGVKESPDMPWADTLALMKTLDAIRAAWSH